MLPEPHRENVPVQAIIRGVDIQKVREKGGSRFALNVPSFVIHPGEFVAIVGASGCGKSTLLDMLALVLQPTSATEFSFCLPGHDTPRHVMDLPETALASIRQADIGYVLQTGGLLPYLSVRDNILLPCQLNGFKGQEAGIQALVERLGIADQLTKKPQHLSGGQRQRVAIARALAHRPPLVLADEPTAAVDKPTALEIRNAFRELTLYMGVTLCMVTHDRTLVDETADRTFTFEVTKESASSTCSTCVEV